MKEKHSTVVLRIAAMILLGFSCILLAHFHIPGISSAFFIKEEKHIPEPIDSRKEKEGSFCDRLMQQWSAPFTETARFLSAWNTNRETYEPSVLRFNLMALPVEEQKNQSDGWTPNFSDISLVSLFHPYVGKNSWGAKYYQDLNSWDAAWLSDVYRWIQITPAVAAAQKGLPESSVLGHFDPSNPLHRQDDPSTWQISQWKNVTFQITDGDGIPCQLHSNARDILAMASVYTYYTGWTDTERFSAYIRQLWQASHHVQVSISPVYYCEGCKSCSEEGGSSFDCFLDGKQESTDGEKMAGPATSSELPAEIVSKPNTVESESALSEEDTEELQLKKTMETNTSKENIFCPGHVDLQILLQIKDFSNQSGLVQADAIGRQSNEMWKGWSPYTLSYVDSLLQENWETAYGLTPVPLSLGQPLSLSSINDYLKLLPEDISQERRAVITCALRSVGKIPYYYGGKPAFPGIEGNHFASVKSPDSKGRILSGLDCSGWINWVYWTALGQRPSEQGTFGLVNAGRSIGREELQPGDLAIRLGTDSHVVMFLAWNADGSMIAVHETAGSINNVTVSSVPGNWPYYRSMFTP